MTPRLTRRGFLAGTTAAALGLPRAAADDDEPPPRRKPLLDLHVHLVGVGDDGSGCVVSPAIRNGPLFQLLLATLQLEKKGPPLDRAFVAALLEQLEQSGLDRCVLLAQDGVYDSRGKLDAARTHFYVPNDYLLEVVAGHADRLVACVSINPLRADALDELAKCCERGARVLKIHPPIQGVDIADARHKPFFRRCAERKLIVMVHTGHERSAPVVDIDLARPEKLRPALDEGCTIVACHCGSGRPGDEPDMLPEFLKLLRDYERPGNLWGDTSILGSLGRSRDFARLLADEVAPARLLHGSDFPFPAAPLEFARQIGAALALALQTDANLLRMDYGLKAALGIGRASAERAYELVCGTN